MVFDKQAHKIRSFRSILQNKRDSFSAPCSVIYKTTYGIFVSFFITKAIDYVEHDCLTCMEVSVLNYDSLTYAMKFIEIDCE